MRTAAIDKQLAQEREKLAEAQADATRAAEQLAKNAADPKLRVAVVEAQQAVAEIQIGIDALNAARVEAVKYDASDEAQAIRKQRAAYAETIKGHHEKMVQAAQAVDDALTRIKEAMGTFHAHRDEALRVAIAYTELMETDVMVRAARAHGLTQISGSLTAAVAKGFIDAMAAAKMPDLSNYVTVNNFCTPSAGSVLDAVAFTAKSAAKSLGEWEQNND